MNGEARSIYWSCVDLMYWMLRSGAAVHRQSSCQCHQRLGSDSLTGIVYRCVDPFFRCAGPVTGICLLLVFGVTFGINVLDILAHVVRRGPKGDDIKEIQIIHVNSDYILMSNFWFYSSWCSSSLVFRLHFGTRLLPLKQAKANRYLSMQELIPQAWGNTFAD